MRTTPVLVHRPRVPYDRAIVRRLLVPLAFTVLVAVGLSACDVSVTPGAARVGSETISRSTLINAVKSVAADAAFICTVGVEASSASISIKGAGSSTYDTGFAASQLTHLIKQRVSAHLLAKLGLTVTPAETAIGLTRLEVLLNPPSGSSCTKGGTTAVSDLAEPYRSVLLSEQTNLDLLATHLAGVPFSAAGLASYATAHEPTAYNACVSAILTMTKSAAVSARSAIESGQSFATVAKADSKDTTSAPDGGVLGCIPTTEFQPPLNTAVGALQVGQLSMPVEFTSGTTTGFVLLLITGRQAPTTLEALDALVNAEGNAANTEFEKAEATTNVSVDPEYGTWRYVSGDYQVVPPAGPSSGYLADPTAITPPTVPLG
ncbi:MAG TPA: peptidylprolyl isomerase [Acidimicrobiales bacterium]